MRGTDRQLNCFCHIVIDYCLNKCKENGGRDSLRSFVHSSYAVWDPDPWFWCSARTSLRFAQVLEKFSRLSSHDSQTPGARLSPHDIGFLPWARPYFQHLTVEHNLRFHGRLHNISETLIQRKYTIRQYRRIQSDPWLASKPSTKERAQQIFR